nr:MAG TPA: Major capsid protein [Caudoviricetes sp.]
MANSIALFKQYIDLLDEVYKNASTTASLDISGDLVKAGANAKEILIPKMTLDGLADYSRSGGYIAGDVKLEMETVSFNFDRGRKFTVDAMDNEETAGVAFGKLASEFIRSKVAPELDAFRYATYSGIAGIGTTAGAALSTGADVLTALVTAQNAMDEAEVPETERELHITPTLYNLIYSVDTTKSKEVLNSFSRIVKVPQTRFYTAIDQYDGTTENETAGGFVKDTTGKNINFMVIHKPAVIQYSKHVVSKVVSPEENQTSDGWMFFYRSYGLADVYDNKVKGIYLHKAAT